MLLEVNSGTLPENATDVITKCELLCKSLLQNEMCQVFYNKIWVITKLQTATILLQIAADITKWDDFFS